MISRAEEMAAEVQVTLKQTIRVFRITGNKQGSL